MATFGLIGKTLSHSFSGTFFEKKFQKEGLTDHTYSLFELENLSDFYPLINSIPDLSGLNVTIPYKSDIIPFLDELEPKARAIGAVNTIQFKNNKLIGFNTDYHGFKVSLLHFLTSPVSRALVLGTGGASKAICAVLSDLNIDYLTVSTSGKGDLNYRELYLDQQELMEISKLIINTTPLGTFPNTDQSPDIPYYKLTKDHFLYDLVYNPAQTSFMKKGMEFDAHGTNGLQMLQLQAEKAWEIWNF